MITQKRLIISWANCSLWTWHNRAYTNFFMITGHMPAILTYHNLSCNNLYLSHSRVHSNLAESWGSLLYRHGESTMLYIFDKCSPRFKLAWLILLVIILDLLSSQWGSLLPGLCTLEPPLSPPSTPAKKCRCMCLGGCSPNIFRHQILFFLWV